MSTTARQMRAWAADNGFSDVAHQRGPIPDDVRQAYWAAHPDDEAVHLTVVEAPAEEETVAGDEFSVAVVIAGCVQPLHGKYPMRFCVARSRAVRMLHGT